MNHSLFSENMKLADLVLANYRLLFIFPRFDIELGVEENTVKQICEQKNISIPLFLLVCNVYTFNEYLPEKHVLDDIPPDSLMIYLRNCHKDYLETWIPQIINEILDITQSCHRTIFEKFCEKYKKEAIVHFEYEENVVFPYIRFLLQQNKIGNYSIEEFEKNHSNIEESLSDLQNILIKYLPDHCTQEKGRKTLIDLFLLEDDLNKHTLLEDRILVSLVKRIERSIQ